MNITIEHNSKTYVVKQGCKYGWTLEVCTPTVKENAKTKESKETYFYPSLELVAKKLTWFEVDATEIQLIVNKNKTNSDRIKSMLEEAL
tara:strand:+ start:105 stop:371 length:267 start_codon:yes stop_codon:yes gene_type:complete